MSGSGVSYPETGIGRHPSTRSLSVALSPVIIPAKDAVERKRKNRLGTSTRRVLSSELTVRQAEALESEGAHFLVSPKGSNSNKNYEEMKQREVRMRLYEEFIGVTWLFCQTDLYSLVSDSLDYFVRKAFSESNDFANILVPTPFKSVNAMHVRYGLLARQVRIGLPSQASADAAVFLMERAEFALSEIVNSNVLHSRNELRKYQQSSLKGSRIFGTHVFSSMLKDLHEGPIVAAEFSSNLPAIKDDIFNFDNYVSLRHMALRALVMKDLVEKMSSISLQGASPIVQELAIKLIKRILSLNAPYSFKASYGDIVVEVIRDGETANDITQDHVFELKGEDGLLQQIS